MSTDREPDLLDWQEPPNGGAVVMPFPLGRCVGKARIVAKVVMRCKTAATQQAAFDRAALALARKLRAARIDEAAVERQIEGFRRTVSVEMQRQLHKARVQA
jgi:Family of unknown function (DUF6074)